MVQMAFCDLLHTFHKQVANVSQHVFVILLWGILTSPLSTLDLVVARLACTRIYWWEIIDGKLLVTKALTFVSHYC